jgi:agmatinase
MFNVVRSVAKPVKIVQVGVRDFSRTEFELAEANPDIVQFPAHKLSEATFAGETWEVQCEKIAKTLSKKVYVSFDIDFLSPEFCPNTGTPVPGGRSFDEAVFLIKKLVDSGREIVGFDLCEVAPSVQNDYDASVGARILFALCGQALRGQALRGGKIAE